MTEEGSLVGRYEFEEEIGVGGMGRVMLARDHYLNRDLALKTLLDKNNRVVRARFLEEGRVMGKLSHPNIVPVHELGRAPDGELYMAMKLVEGQDLGDIVKELGRRKYSVEKEFPLRRLLRIFLKVCDAMAYAHKQGYLHRDLKPANIMIGLNGEVLVMDWGLAKIIDENGVVVQADKNANIREAMDKDQELSQRSAELTTEGAVIGTPSYMPPEQADNAPDLDIRADVYALGSILYELLTHTRPYDGSLVQVLNALFKSPPESPRERAPDRDIPPALEAITLKAMARKRKYRYPDVRSLADDVEAFLDGQAVSAFEETFKDTFRRVLKRNRRILSLSVVSFVGLTVGLFFAINLTQRWKSSALLESRRSRMLSIDAKLASKDAEILSLLPTLTGQLVNPVKAVERFVLKSAKAIDIQLLRADYEKVRARLDAAILEIENAVGEGQNSRFQIREFESELSEKMSELEVDIEGIDGLGDQWLDLRHSYDTTLGQMRREQSFLRSACQKASRRLDQALARMLVCRHPKDLLEIFRGKKLDLEPGQSEVFNVRALQRLFRVKEARELLTSLVSNKSQFGSFSEAVQLQLTALEGRLRNEPQALALKEQKALVDAALAKTPDLQWLYTMKAEIFVGLGRFTEAKELYAQGAALRPTDAWLHVSRMQHTGTVYTIHDVSTNTEKLVLFLAPQLGEISLLVRTRYLWRNRSKHKEIGAFSKELQGFADNKLVGQDRVDRYVALGAAMRADYDLVEQRARKILERDSRDCMGLGMLAYSVLQRGLLDEAERQARFGLRTYPEDGLMNFVAGEALRRKGAYAEAFPLLRLGARSSLDPRPCERLARCAAKLDNPEAWEVGVAAVRKALSLDCFGAVTRVHAKSLPRPGLPIYHETYGALRRRQGRLAQAALHYQRAASQAYSYWMRKKDEAKAKQTLVENTLKVGEIYEEMKLKDEAIEAYEQLLRLKDEELLRAVRVHLAKLKSQ